jgi:hypothetical protein
VIGVYVVLLVVTFTAHAALVGFVLGATAWATVRALRGGDDPVAAASRDWLPFALGAAITAGVAPLLLVQVLYQQRMYTATLLLSHRFMAIVPALIVGFYLLYLAKTARVAAWPPIRRAAVTGVALALFVFVAWTWVEEHMLAQAESWEWARHYGERRVVHGDIAIAPRLLLWLGLAVTSFAAGASWLARAAEPRDLRRLGVAGTVGVGVAVACMAVIAATGGDAVPPGSTPWIALGTVALTVAFLGFGSLWNGHVRQGRWMATTGVALLYLAISAIREARRADTIVWRSTLDGAQGLPLFVLFAVGGTVAIVWCARLVTRNLR